MKNRYEFYYEVLENFQGSKDNFWRCEKYLATDFERNGFTVEELISNGKIEVGIKRNETVYYMALDVFQGSDDVFWSSEIYDIEDIESNGFTVDSLMEEGKIRLWQEDKEKPSPTELGLREDFEYTGEMLEDDLKAVEIYKENEKKNGPK